VNGLGAAVALGGTVGVFAIYDALSPKVMPRDRMLLAPFPDKVEEERQALWMATGLSMGLAAGLFLLHRQVGYLPGLLALATSAFLHFDFGKELNKIQPCPLCQRAREALGLPPIDQGRGY